MFEELGYSEQVIQVAHAALQCSRTEQVGYFLLLIAYQIKMYWIYTLLQHIATTA